MFLGFHIVVNVAAAESYFILIVASLIESITNLFLMGNKLRLCGHTPIWVIRFLFDNPKVFEF
jgi:hypothetical protein